MASPQIGNICLDCTRHGAEIVESSSTTVDFKTAFKSIMRWEMDTRACEEFHNGTSVTKFTMSQMSQMSQISQCHKFVGADDSLSVLISTQRTSTNFVTYLGTTKKRLVKCSSNLLRSTSSLLGSALRHSFVSLPISSFNFFTLFSLAFNSGDFWAPSPMSEIEIE